MEKEFAAVKIQELDSCCRENGVPLTVQRRIVLETLAGRKDHPTADQVYDAVKGIIKGVSRTTVYRVLETFVRLGLAVRVCSPHGKGRFDADTGRHHHLICLECEKVVDFKDERLQLPQLAVLAVTDFEIKDYSLAITGYCASCRDKINH
jgi:Fur family peroxide stress response transcriptional regulator